MKQITCLLAIVVASLASCQTVGRTPAEQKELEPSAFRWSLEAFHQDTDVDEIEYDDPPFVSETLKDVRRRRSGIRASFGVEWVQGYAQIFDEDFVSSEGGAGMGFGAQATPGIYSFKNGAKLILPYRSGFTMSGGRYKNGLSEGDYALFEWVGELGIGVDYHGWRPSVGFTVKRAVGTLAFDNEPNNADEWEDLNDIRGSYGGGYAELAYRSGAVPVQLAVRGIAGSENGVLFSLSWLF